MFELIFIIFIIIYFSKKNQANNESSILNVLRKNQFKHITIVKNSVSTSWITATLYGDNYLFFIAKNTTPISHIEITTFAEYATKAHIHNMVVIPGNAVISNPTKQKITENNIHIWDKQKIDSLDFSSVDSTSSSKTVINSVAKMPLDDHCKIETSNDPIQDGSKANSLFSSLFGKKTERL